MEFLSVKIRNLRDWRHSQDVHASPSSVSSPRDFFYTIYEKQQEGKGGGVLCASVRLSAFILHSPLSQRRAGKMKSCRKARETEQSVLAINSGLLVRGDGTVFIRLRDGPRVHALSYPALVPFTIIRFSTLYFPLCLPSFSYFSSSFYSPLSPISSSLSFPRLRGHEL